MLEQKIDILSDRVLDKADAICFTSNQVIKTGYLLVMGAGVAKAFRDRFLLVDGAAADTIKKNGYQCQVVDWSGYVDVIKRPPVPIVMFPTKYHWRDPSDIQLIEKSARELMTLIEENDWKLVALPRPGCSNGGLRWEDVKKVIESILDNRVVIVSL